MDQRGKKSDAADPRPVFIRIADISNMTAVSARTIKRYVAAGVFPKPIKLTARTSVWFEHEIIEWMNNQADALRAA